MKTSDLINNLSKDAKAVEGEKPLAIFSRWMVFSVVYLALMTCIFHLRDDILLQLQKPLFLAEIGALMALGIAVGISSIILSYPDSYQKKHLIYLPAIPLAAFITVIWFQAKASVSITHNLDGEVGCFICICIFALGPGIFLFRQMMKNATTSPRLAGLMGSLAAFFFGALIIRLTEKVDSMEHIILVHYVPLIFIAAIGTFVGRKFLKW